jgi:hypothetical protein
MNHFSLRALARRLFRSSSAAGTTLLAIGLAAGLPAHAQQQAHTHGRLALDVAVDARAITISMEAPLDNFLGFERAPRTAAERRQVAELVARLNNAATLFIPDPAAGCRLDAVALESEVLDLPESDTDSHGHTDADADADTHTESHEGHADIDARFTFTCTDGNQARFMDVQLFSAFKRIRTIDVQVAHGQGQVKRQLTRSATRLRWSK